MAKSLNLSKVVCALVVTVVLVLSATASAGPFAGGTGGPNDPHQIATAEQLIVMGQDTSLYDKHFVLVADIDLDPNLPGRVTFARSVIAPYGQMPRTPVHGLAYGLFTGCFDGAGHVIRNMVIRADAAPTAGLFGYIGATGRIEDLGLEGVDIRQSSRTGPVFVAGSLAAVNQGGTILRCYGRGSIAGPERIPVPAGPSPRRGIRALAAGSSDEIGGLIGVNAGLVNTCYAIVDVSGTGVIGGLIGQNSSGMVYFSFSAGRVRGTGWPGGLIGQSEMTTSSRAGSMVWNNADTAVRCFWDVEASGMLDSAAGEGRTTTELMSRQTYASWAHIGVWTVDDANDYPRLLWEQAAGALVGTGQSGYGGGSGDPDDPYKIQTAEQFLTIGCHPEEFDKCFVLTADLDFNSVDHSHFLPIGFKHVSFTGQFDGQGHSLSNLRISQPRESGVGVFGLMGAGALAVRNEGFHYEIGSNGSFGWGSHGSGYPVATSECAVKNLHLYDMSVTGQQYVGGLIGVGVGTVTDCSVSGQVTGMALVGGLAGRFPSGTISNCSADVQVSGEFGVGGLVGMTGGVANVFDSQAGGVVTGQVFTGGLIGYSLRDAISGCAALADVHGRYHAGGCLGSAGGSTITLSCCLGAVTGEQTVGGFAGDASGASINDCYCRSDVTGGRVVGGFAGHSGSRGHIARCYATSSVTATEVDPKFALPSVGGFIGYASQSDDSACEGDCPVSSSACFWDTDVSGQAEAFGNRPADPGTATGLTTAQMQSAAPFGQAGWDFATTWTICEGKDDPRLRWEGVACDE